MPQIKGLGLGQIHRYCIFSFFGFMQIASCICFCFVSFSFGLKFSEIIFTCLQFTIMIWNKVKWESNRLKRCKLNHLAQTIYTGRFIPRKVNSYSVSWVICTHTVQYSLFYMLSMFTVRIEQTNEQEWKNLLRLITKVKEKVTYTSCYC